VPNTSGLRVGTFLRSSVALQSFRASGHASASQEHLGGRSRALCGGNLEVDAWTTRQYLSRRESLADDTFLSYNAYITFI
jgi:hypothetical protein